MARALIVHRLCVALAAIACLRGDFAASDFEAIALRCRSIIEVNAQ
jgi:hypothetical protein